MSDWEVVQSLDNKLSNKLSNIEKMLKDNRQSYMELMKENRELARLNSQLVRDMVKQREEDRSIYSKNKELYLSYLESITKKEESMETILEDLKTTSNSIKEAINNPMLFSRMHNYQWRMFSGISVTPRPFIRPKE